MHTKFGGGGLKAVNVWLLVFWVKTRSSPVDQ